MIITKMIDKFDNIVQSKLLVEFLIKLLVLFKN